MRINWTDQKQVIEELSLSGKTLKEIGEVFGVSKQRIRQVFQKFGINIPRHKRGLGKKAADARAAFIKNLQERTDRDTWRHPDEYSRAVADCFRRKRQNSRSTKWEWEIEFTDLVYPSHCPLLGIELDWFADYRADNSPSFDRIDNTKGYIPGNVVVCSWRANRIKNDGNAEEHKRIADFLDKYNSVIIAS